jgi:purine-binding chemotaxis protein CheW
MNTEPDDIQLKILRARARALAGETAGTAPTPAVVEVIAFTLAHERYAVETSCIREIHVLEDLTPLPCTPDFIVGIVNLRGCITAVVDLKKFFDLPEPGFTDAHRVLVIQNDSAFLQTL